MIPLRDSKPSHHFPLWTIILIILNAAVFYWELTSPESDAFIHTYGLVPALIDNRNPATWYPFVTSLFLHGGFLHLGLNMLFLWVFGDNVEDHLSLFYVPFYILGGILGALAQYVFMQGADIPIVGASGAIAAVMGAYIVYHPHSRIQTLVFILVFITIIEIPAIVMLGYWFALQLLSGYSSINDIAAGGGGVAYFSHIAGFVTGLVVGWATKPYQLRPSRV
ncbi:MAG TPA: rhomboid family intramembrane serine protease [Patescibacteria group bacterium]